MSISDLDIDIDNYNYLEMLQLFKIKNDFNDFNQTNIEKIIKIIKDKLSLEYYIFYSKVGKILLTIHYLFNNKIIEKNDDHLIETFINKIKLINSFETYDISDLIYKLNIHPLKVTETNNIDNVDKPILNEKNAPPKIQEQKYTNYVESVVSNAVSPGDLNAIKRVTQLLNLNLNTCFRTNYYFSSPCNFQYIIPTEIKNVVSLRLASIEIPNSWYLFSSIRANNIFEIEVYNPLREETCSYKIVIPDGNYDNCSLTEFLNDTYFCNSKNNNDLMYIKFCIDYSSSKSIFHLTGSYPKDLCFSLFFYNEFMSNKMNTFGWIIGYRYADYENITNEIISEGIFDGGGDRYVYVSIDDYQYNKNTSNIVCFDHSIMEQNIIAKIPMVNGKLALIVDNNCCLTKTRIYNGPVNIRNLFIKIIDQYGIIIDLNNMDFSFTLELEILYEGFNFKHINS
jgi:hypothetical protein